VASTLALAACGKATESGNTDATTSAASTATTTAETTETMMATTEADGEISADYNDADIMFAQMMIPHYQQAVEMSEMLLAKEGIPAQVVEFAQGVIVNCGPGLGAPHWGMRVATPTSLVDDTPLTPIPPRGTLSLMSNEHGYHGNTENHLARLRRIEGQVRGLQRMISQGDYCIDILTQVSAVQSALDSVAVNLLKDHMNHCVVTAARESDEAAQAKVDEAAAAIARLIKS